MRFSGRTGDHGPFMTAFSFRVPVVGGYPVLLEGGAGVLVRKSLARLVASSGGELAAYCLLPDAVIGVISGDGAEVAIARFVDDTAKELSRRRSGSGWGVAELTPVADVAAASREALMAPVREGLARSAALYAHSGSHLFEVAELVG